MIMTVFSTMKMPMEFVISSAFLTPFSFPENDAMHPVLLAFEVPMEHQSSSYGGDHRYLAIRIHVRHLHRFCRYGVMRLSVPDHDCSPSALRIL